MTTALGSMFIGVESAVELVLQPDIEAVELFGIGEGAGEWAQGCCGAERAVGSVLVVEGFVFAECVQEVRLVPDEGAVEEFGSA